MRFEKWQALGNDYIIVEDGELPFELTPQRIRLLCRSHVGVFADGVLLLSRSEDHRFVASLRIYNPDGSEAELSGNGAREAILYLHRRGWTDRDGYSISTVAGPVAATITGPNTCRVDMGHASLTSPNFPAGPPDGRGELSAGGKTLQFQFVSIGNPQCAIFVRDFMELEQMDRSKIGREISHHHLFPNRTNVSWWYTDGTESSRISARIFERGVGETESSGTGAIGAAVAYYLDSGTATERLVTVGLPGGELEVEVGEDLHINLTGEAQPVFEGTLSKDFLKELNETQ
jgi:diaminopimelate epimerase